LQIDSRKMTAGQTWPVAPGVGPRTMAVDQRNGRLFIGCANRRMIILDSNNGRVPRYQSGRDRMTPLTIRKHGSYIRPVAARALFRSSSRNLQTTTACLKP